MTKRLFIALNLPADIKSELAKLVNILKAGSVGVSWCHQDDIHLTLHFLGNIRQEKIEQIKSVMQSLASRCGRLEFALGGLSAFPNLAHPRVIFIGLKQINGQSVYELQELLGEKLNNIKFATDQRPWKPHLTLGRVKTDFSQSAARINTANLTITTKQFSVATFELIESRLKLSGPEYYKIMSYKL